MTSAVVLFLVALVVVPVAAEIQNPWPSNNDTFIVPANGMRTYGDSLEPYHDFKFNSTPGYYFWMVNGTQGMNAIHITDTPSSSTFSGGIYNAKPTSGIFYVSSTGGHTGDDDVLLLISVNSTNQTDIDRFSLDLDVSGYNWDPLNNAIAPEYDYYDEEFFNNTYYNSSTVSATFNATHYLENLTASGNDVTQIWKFAPLDNYPIFSGQNMATDQNFKQILVDLNAGTISSGYGENYRLHDWGMTNVSYTITSNPSSAANITFNAYVYNWDAPQAKKTVHWLNRVNKYGESASGCSVWKVTPP